MFRKIEVWIVGLVILFFILLIIFMSGVLRDAYLGKNVTPKFLRDNFVTIAEIPKNIYHVTNFFIDRNSPPKLIKHKDKNRFVQFIPNKRNALLVLPRYDHSLGRSLVDIVDLNNFEIIHSYMHDIDEMNAKITNKINKNNANNNPIRFKYNHPLILDDGSLISSNSLSIKFKIDFCSNLQWINDTEVFHHSIMMDYEGYILTAGQIPKSKFVLKYATKDFLDDSIIKINIDGKILYNKSVTEILIENKFGDLNLFENKVDPIHLNDIEPVLKDSKYWKKGDVFLSPRHLSAIIHFRPDTNKVINYITGPFARQHDIDIISNKEISIFNNNNFLIDNEFSEIVIYNFETKSFRKMFNNQLRENNFKTDSEGLSHIFNDGSLMVEEQNHGRIILFNNRGEKEWEFVNKDENEDIGIISWSRIIEDELFIDKYKSLIKTKKCLN